MTTHTTDRNHADTARTTHERNVIVTAGDGRSGLATAVIALVAIGAIAVLAYLFMGTTATEGSGDGSAEIPAVEMNLDAGSPDEGAGS